MPCSVLNGRLTTHSNQRPFSRICHHESLSQVILLEHLHRTCGGTVIPESSALSDSTPLEEVSSRILRTDRACTALWRSGNEPYQSQPPDRPVRISAYLVHIATIRKDVNTTNIADPAFQLDGRSDRATAIRTSTTCSPIIGHSATHQVETSPTWSLPSRGKLRVFMLRCEYVPGEDLSSVDF